MRRPALAPAVLVALVLALWTGCQPAESQNAAPQTPSSPPLTAAGLLNGVQTYCMVPVLPKTARSALHATVNGVWGGISGTDPILTYHGIVPTVTAAYSDDASFVAACHKAGLYVCGVVNGIEGFAPMRKKWPDLVSMACRDAQGKPVVVGNGMMLMCTNNPGWQRWELDQGKRAIDAGADLILVDTPMSSAFVSGILKAGFCKYCMANFRAWLRRKFTPAQLRERFGIAGPEDLRPSRLIPRLSPLQNIANPKMRPFTNTSKDDLLFRQFIYCQEQASFDTRKALTDGLRAYAKAKGRHIVLACNAADLGTANPAGFWIRGLMFADLFDQFIYEQNVLPMGMPNHDEMRYPRGKWVAYHKLAYAVHHRRAPAVINAEAMGRILTGVLGAGKTVNTWMEVQSAEAYAADGAYVQYYVAPPGVGDKLLGLCWAGSAKQAAFVQAHRDLYDGDLRSGSSLAILFLYNERGRTVPGAWPSYLGFAQALTEGNYPFDVVFGGDGHYVRDRLSAAGLAPYRTLLIPSPIAPTANQKRLVQAFVRGGGTAVCEEPEALGLKAATTEAKAQSQAAAAVPPCIARRFGYGKGRVWVLAGKVTETSTGDVGANFFRGYSPLLRTQIGMLAKALGYASVAPHNAAGLVCAYPLVQPKRGRLVVHLVNYDVDYAADKIREKTDVALRLPRPAFLRGRVSASLIASGAAPAELPVDGSDATLSVTVPRLGAYAAVVFR